MTKAASSAHNSVTHFFSKTTFILQCVPEVLNITENVKTNTQSLGSNSVLFWTALSRTLSELFFF